MASRQKLVFYIWKSDKISISNPWYDFTETQLQLFANVLPCMLLHYEGKGEQFQEGISPEKLESIAWLAAESASPCMDDDCIRWVKSFRESVQLNRVYKSVLLWAQSSVLPSSPLNILLFYVLVHQWKSIVLSWETLLHPHSYLCFPCFSQDFPSLVIACKL